MTHSNVRKRGRLVGLMAALLVLGLEVDLIKLNLIIDKNRKKEINVFKDYSKRRDGLTIEKVTEVLRDCDFARYFRMTRSTFRKLLLIVEPGLQRNTKMGLLSKRPAVIPELRLAICLCMMTGGSPGDISTSYKIDPRTVYRIFHQTRKVFDRHLKFPGIPQDFEGLKQMADDFQASRAPGNPLPGCIGAMDGISVKIKAPPEEEHPASYWCRKGYHALPVQAVCDSHYRFVCYSATCRGSTHDSLAHSVSALGKYLQEARLHVAFWLAVDEAYVCNLSLITPIPGTQATGEEDAFNFYHSSSRMHIEQAFGMLVRKWSILKHMEYAVQVSAEIIGLAMKLHNFCIDQNGSRSVTELSSEQKKAIEESEQWYLERRDDYNVLVSELAHAKRNHLINIIREGKFKRPPIGPVRVARSL